MFAISGGHAGRVKFLGHFLSFRQVRQSGADIQKAISFSEVFRTLGAGAKSPSYRAFSRGDANVSAPNLECPYFCFSFVVFPLLLSSPPPLLSPRRSRRSLSPPLLSPVGWVCSAGGLVRVTLGSHCSVVIPEGLAVH